jgi:hypothetical protein
MRVQISGLVLAWMIAVAGCASGTSIDRSASSTTSTTTSLVRATTTQPIPMSAATLRHDGTEYDFRADCYDAGAGAVIVLAEGSDEPVTRLIVQAIVGEAYLEFTDESGTVYEPSIEHLVDFTVEDGSVSSGIVNLVTGLDLGTGAFEPAGIASFEVVCNSYIHGPPEGY